MLHQYTVNDFNAQPKLLKKWLTEKIDKNVKTVTQSNSNKDSNKNSNGNTKK